MKQKKNHAEKSCPGPVVLTAVLMICLNTFKVFGCGGGVVPYIPSGTGSAGSGSSSGQFFLFDKGVTSTMLDYRAVQPLFKNIVNSGNERKARGQEIKKAEPFEVTADSTKTVDSTKTAEHNIVGEDALPVLNLHQLH